MATITRKPTGILYGASHWTDGANVYDNDASSYGAVSNSSSEQHTIFSAFDFSAIPENAVITGFTFTIKVYVSGRVRVRVIKNVTGSSSWTDINNNTEIVVSDDNSTTNTTYTSANLPNVVQSLNADKSTWQNKNLFFKLQIKKFTSIGLGRVYDAYYTITYRVPKYVYYDTLFSFKKWKDEGIASGSNATISNISDVGFSLYAGAKDSYTANSPKFPVIAGKSYTFEYEHSGNGNEVFVFFHTSASASWDSFFNTTENKLVFTVPDGHSYLSVRCDSNIAGNTVNYSNFRIYPTEYKYMSDSVSAYDRTDTDAWSMPTPKRDGYIFKGWNTAADGKGTSYTSGSQFPANDLTLYSQWAANIFAGNKRVTPYIGNKKVQAVYVGTKRIL